jgi:hypothetical protein
MKTPTKYWCSEVVIMKARMTQTLSPRNYSGYLIFREKGWIFE